MWRALLLIAVTLAFAAQPWHITGQVIDENGRPIADAFFDEPGLAAAEQFEHYTNAEGRFDIWTNSPSIVLRKTGYRDLVLTSKDVSKHELKMIKESKQQRSK